MAAGRLSVVADVQDLADLGKCEPGSLAAVDEVDAGDGLGRVVAIARRGALGGRQQPLLAGGKGNVAGTLAGVAIFAVLDNVMGVMQVNPFLRDVIRGVVIVAAVAVYARREIDRRPAPFDRPGARTPTLQEASPS